MSGLLLHEPAEVIAQMLVDLGVATDPESADPDDAWPAYSGTEPDGPDDCITVRGTTGQDMGSSMIDGHRWESEGFQIRVRTSPHTKRAGFAKATAIGVALDERSAQRVVVLDGTTYTVSDVCGRSPVLQIGPEKATTRRELFTINCYAIIDIHGARP